MRSWCESANGTARSTASRRRNQHASDGCRKRRGRRGGGVVEEVIDELSDVALLKLDCDGSEYELVLETSLGTYWPSR